MNAVLIPSVILAAEIVLTAMVSRTLLCAMQTAHVNKYAVQAAMENAVEMTDAAAPALMNAVSKG